MSYKDWNEPEVLSSKEIPEVPKHQKKAPKKKPYGIEYFSGYLGRWLNHNWYVTEKARDEAFKNITSKTDAVSIRMASQMRKVDR